MSATLDPPLDDGAAQTRTQRALGVTGGTIGPYRLLERLGEGGMGEVWLAEQTRPVRRQVAFKIIKAGMDTTQVVARFEAERQALALMDHPAIAKVFDAGATDSGRPYFAMEYVRGESLNAYCDRERLTIRQRLELFLHVCEGVQHAHQKGIIHRDLKPSNILVTLQDDHPVPKIIDFGVAKAMSQPLTEHTLYTSLGGFVGTPEYMSPEQAEMSGVDVDTRTDIYALGVVLYELLTGALPFDRQTFRDKSIDDIRRTIREVIPVRPSARITRMGAASTEHARSRRMAPSRLAGLLDGDLDWITMKALEKERARRYVSASDLAADIRHHLTHQPVSAGPPSVIYRSGKFVRRHRFGVTATVVLIVLSITFGAAMTVQARRIASERDRANREASASHEISQFLIGLFNIADPSESRGNTITAREILGRGSRSIDAELRGQPLVQARLLMVMGRVYESLGLYDISLDLFERALSIRRTTLGTSPIDVAESLNCVGRAFWRKGDYADAESRIREALAARRALLGPTHIAVAESLDDLGTVLFQTGDYAGADALFREALAMRRALLGDQHKDVAASLNNLAITVEYLSADYSSEVTMLTEVLAIHRRRWKDDHPDIAQAQNNLGMAYYRMRNYSAAEPFFRDSLVMNRRIFGDAHPETSAVQNNLGLLLRDKGDHRGAKAQFADAISSSRAAFGPEHPETLNILINLATTESAGGNYREAQAMFREVLAIQLRNSPENALRIATTKGLLGADLIATKQYREAELLLTAAQAVISERFGNAHPRTQAMVRRLVALYEAWGKADERAHFQALVVQ